MQNIYRIRFLAPKCRWLFLALTICFQFLNHNLMAKGTRYFDLSKFETYLVYYGPWDEEKINFAQAFELVIAHPGERGENLTQATVQKIQWGRDGRPATSDDVKVLSYVSIGESTQVVRGFRSKEKIGPCVREADGSITYTKQGFDSWNCDETRIKLDSEGQVIWGEDGYPVTEKGRDGLPDENGKWGSYYARAGDENWQSRLRQRMRMLSQTGTDGFFLDTVDTASPWGAYGWMQEEMTELILNIRQWNPRSILVMNRGLFLFEKWGQELSQAVDAVMFESYVSEWNWYLSVGQVHDWYGSNREVLQDQLWPKLKNSKASILFLNYYDKSQNDANAFAYLQNRDANGMRALNYVSSPDLGQLFNPLKVRTVVTPKTKPCKVWFEDRQIHISPEEKSGTPLIELSPPWGEHQASFIPQNELSWEDNILVLPELPAGQYEMLLTWLNSEGEACWSTREDLKIPAEGGQVWGWPKILMTALDGYVQLEWDGDAPAQASVILQWGDDPKNLFQSEQWTSLPARITGLANGKTIFGRCAQIVEGNRGPWSPIVPLSPHDCTPPLPPKIVSVDIQPKRVVLEYQIPDGSDCTGVNLRIEQEGLGIGMPLELPFRARKWTMERQGQRCRLHLSLVDASNNESKAVLSKWID